MTTEKAIEFGKIFLKTIADEKGSATYEFVETAVKMMEQQPILDKIRAEIKALSPEPTAFDVVDGNPIKDAIWETIANALKIIDKYKTESEGKE